MEHRVTFSGGAACFTRIGPTGCFSPNCEVHRFGHCFNPTERRSNKLTLSQLGPKLVFFIELIEDDPTGSYFCLYWFSALNQGFDELQLISNKRQHSCVVISQCPPNTNDVTTWTVGYTLDPGFILSTKSPNRTSQQLS